MNNPRPRSLRKRFVVGTLFVATLACTSCKSKPKPAQVRIGQAVWTVELATTEAARRRGLAGRKDVPEGTGMLFVFPTESRVGFHMKGCLVPLDIAFISSDLIVVRTETMRLERDPAKPKNVYHSERAVRYALEVPAGALDRAGVKPADRVELLGPARDAAKDAE